MAKEWYGFYARNGYVEPATKAEIDELVQMYGKSMYELRYKHARTWYLSVLACLRAEKNK